MILVTGATGSIGRPLVKQLQAKGAAVRALVRDASKGRSLGCEYAVGEFDDLGSMRSALAGVDRLFLNGPASEAMVRQQSAVINLAVELGVSYIVGLSSVGADVTSDLSIGKWHGDVDARLAASGVPWSVLRPGYFMQNIARNAASIRSGRIVGAFKDGRVAAIDAVDIAACAVVLLTGPVRSGESFTLTGVESYTQAEIAQRLTARLGHPVTYTDVPVERIVAGMISAGVPSVLAHDLGLMQTRIAASARVWASPAVAELLGRPPRTLDQFLDDNLDLFR